MPEGIGATVSDAAAAAARISAIDRLRELLGPAFAGSTVTTEYGAPAALTGHPHTGLDLAAAEGTPIQEPIGGTVEQFFTDNSGGHQLVVRTPEGYREVYAHLLSVPANIATTPDAPVPAGTTIGYVGSTGMATGAHLHYEVVKPGGRIGRLADTIDPATFIGEFASRPGPARPPDVAERGQLSPERVAEIQSFVDNLARQIMWGRLLGVSSTPTDQQAAVIIRQKFPDASPSQLAAITRSGNIGPDSSRVPILGGIGAAIAGTAGTGIPVLSGIDQIANTLGKLTDPHTQARVGLSGAALALIIVGVVLYVRGMAR